MSEIDQRRSLTPCLDENRVDDDPGGDNSKEIELSDISDEDDGFQWPEDVSNGKAANGNGKAKNDQLAFKKITRSNRDRNYRDKLSKRDDEGSRKKGAYTENNSNRGGRYRKPVENKRKQEIPRYDVRKVIANRDFSISRSRSRSFSPQPVVSRHRRGSYSPLQRREAISPNRPFHTTKSHRYSDTRHSPSLSPDRYRNYQQYKSLTPPDTFTVIRRSRSKNKHNKLNSKFYSKLIFIVKLTFLSFRNIRSRSKEEKTSFKGTST